MVVALPDELLDTIQQQVALRQAQLQQLNLFYNDTFPSPQVVVTYGSDDTCQLETILKVLNSQRLQHVVINCKECLSQRHLLSKIFARCVTELGKEDQLDRYDRLDSINALASNLKKLLQTRKEKFLIILLSADQQRGATLTLFPALARLGDYIPCLSLILTSSSPRPLILHKAGIPYIHFPPRTRTESIQLLLQAPPLLVPHLLPDGSPNIDVDRVRSIYNQFATVIYDTLIAPTTDSLTKYRQTIERLWPRFIWPYLSGEKGPGKNPSTDWDFARLLSRNRALFQAEGEEALQERLIPILKEPCTFEELTVQKQKQESGQNGMATVAASLAAGQSPFKPVQPLEHTATSSDDPPLLKYLTTILLLSCYLASHTHPRHDIVLFSRLSTASSTNRRKKKYLARSRAGGITKTPTKSPSKKKSLADDDDDDDDLEARTPSKKTPSKEDGTPKKERADRSMRAIFEKTSNIARPFTLERVIAILRAIHPDGIKMGKSIADRVYVELGELERLRLVVRADAGRAGQKGDSDDIMEEKWKCVVGREWVTEAGRRWSVGLEGWEVE